MDVVPTDPARWAKDPFGAEIADGKMWGRGTIDMKGIGTSYLYAFIMLHRQKVPLTRDVLLMFVPDEEVGGDLGAAWMRKNHYDELDPEYVIDEGGFGSRDMFTAGKLVFGISVAEKKIMWLKLRAEGRGRPRIAAARQEPQRSPDAGAVAPVRASRSRRRRFRVVETMKQRIVGPLAANKFNNAIQQSTISLTSLRSGVGDPPKVNVIPSVAEATLDCRVLPGTTAEQWIKEVERRLADPTIKIEVINAGEDPVVTPAGHADVPRARGRHQAASPRGDRHADDRAVRHRLQRVPSARREELRHLPRHHPCRVDPLDARRRRVHAGRRARAGDPDSVRGAERDRVEVAISYRASAVSDQRSVIGSSAIGHRSSVIGIGVDRHRARAERWGR